MPETRLRPLFKFENVEDRSENTWPCTGAWVYQFEMARTLDSNKSRVICFFLCPEGVAFADFEGDDRVVGSVDEVLRETERQTFNR